MAYVLLDGGNKWDKQKKQHQIVLGGKTNKSSENVMAENHNNALGVYCTVVNFDLSRLQKNTRQYKH